MSLYRRFLLLALMSAHRSGLGYYLPNAIQKKAAPYPMEGVVGSGVFCAALSSYGSGAAYSVPHIVLAAQRLNQRNRVESFPVCIAVKEQINLGDRPRKRIRRVLAFADGNKKGSFLGHLKSGERIRL